MSAYASTNVTVERSQAELRKLFQRFGVDRLGFGEETDDAGVRWAAVTFTHAAYAVRLRVPLKLVDEREVERKARRARSKTANEIRNGMYEQEEKRIWRVLAWNLKARMVAVDEGVESFEQAFLPHLVNPATGQTVYEDLAIHGRIELPAPLLALEEGR